MEQHSLHGEGSHTMVKKVATMFSKNDFPSKTDIKKIPAQKPPFFLHFYYFLYFAALWSPRDHILASPPRA
jgi:hypothetical protein